MCSFTSVFCQSNCVLFVRNLVKGFFKVRLQFHLIPISPQKCSTAVPVASAVLIVTVSCDSRRSSSSVHVCPAALNHFCLLLLCLAYFLLPLPISLGSCYSLFTYRHELPSFFSFSIDITAFYVHNRYIIFLPFLLHCVCSFQTLPNTHSFQNSWLSFPRCPRRVVCHSLHYSGVAHYLFLYLLRHTEASLFSGVFVIRTLEEKQQYFSSYCYMGNLLFGEQPSAVAWHFRVLQALA